MCPSLRLEIYLIATLLREEISSVSTPIAHLVEQEPTFVSYGEASLINGGGWSIDLRFWWCIVWSEEISICNFLAHLPRLLLDISLFGPYERGTCSLTGFASPPYRIFAVTLLSSGCYPSALSKKGGYFLCSGF